MSDSDSLLVCSDYGAVSCSERRRKHSNTLQYCVRTVRVQVVFCDVWQRHARGDVLLRRVSARESTARLQIRVTRAHPVAATQTSPVARGSAPRRRVEYRSEMPRRYITLIVRDATRAPPRTHRPKRRHRVRCWCVLPGRLAKCDD